MTDTPGSDIQLDSTWRSFGNGMAALAGASTALISLFADVSLATACGRGAAALLGVQVVVRLTASALHRTCDPPVDEAPATEESQPETRDAA